MISFAINTLRLLRALVSGFRHDQEFRILLVLLTTMLIGSTLFYAQTEGWSALDALYFSVMTMSTIGYGDLVPSTNLSKVFTIVFTFLSVGLFVAVNTKIVMIILEKRKAKKRHKAAKRSH